VWAACDDDGQVVVHRVRAVRADAVVLQGDRRVRPDAPFPSGRLVGRVRAVEVDGRRLARLRWGRGAGALQRLPRSLVATIARARRTSAGLRA
jgi:hypothetical protein